ncbi:MAG: T9SS type A sorting domain-containing protein [Ignavibacteriaceae bacterium]|nr:T9SS type A sorting domain-containing protein [Ignavibacteriaceae bacterium]
MKKILLAVTLLFTAYLNAQSLLPKAGEYLSDETDIIELIKSTMPKTPYNNEKLSVIDFDSSNASFKGNYPFSYSYALAMSPEGDLVFVGSGGGIYVTDVSDPQNTVILSEVRTRSLVDQCTYDPVTKRLYICAYFSGIEIWDLSDLSNPTRMSRFPTEPYPRSGIAYFGNYLIFTTNYSIWSLDISDPYNPVIADELFLANNLISQMYLKGNTAYIVMSSQGVKLVNVSNPLDLQLITSYGFLSGNEIDIAGNFLYGINSSGALTILNITDSLHIVYAGVLNVGGFTYDIEVFNNKAYIAKVSTDGGLQIVDVTNPATPVSISLYPGDYEFLTGMGDYAYLSRNSTFSILDVSDSSSVQYVSGFDLPGFVNDVAVSGTYAYTGSNGFRVLDVSDSTHPVEVGFADIDGSLVEVAGNSVVVYSPYSMTANNTFYTMDVSDPANPVSLDSYTCPAMTWDLVVKDDLLFIACWWDGVRIFNISDPTNIIQLSRVMGWQSGGVPGVEWCYAQAINVEGNYLYIVDYQPFSNEDTYGLYIIDISNPSSPFLVNRFQTMISKPQDIDVEYDNAFIADGNGGIESVAIWDPMNPYVIGYLDLIDGSTGIKVDGIYAYVSEYILGGLQIADISFAGVPDLVGWYQPSGVFALGVETFNGFVYVSDGLGGIQIYRNLLVDPVSVEPDEVVVNDFKLEQNYPNPFNPSTKIKYTIPDVALRQAQSDILVTLKVYDILGNEVATLVNEEQAPGVYEVEFNVAQVSRPEITSGVYFYQLRAGEFYQTMKMILVK